MGGDGWEQTDVPLAESGEAYEIDIMDGASAVRTLSSNQPSLIYTTSQQTADFGAPQPSYTVRIYQISASYGRGQAREAMIP
jgi:hypothetical protein